MGKQTGIAWTDHTFNGWIGCTKISPGCTNCYAEELMWGRWQKTEWGVGKPRKLTSDNNWNEVQKWDREAQAAGVRAKVFAFSLADVFDEEVPDAWRDDFFTLVLSCPHLDFQVLTKRCEKADDYLGLDAPDRIGVATPFPNVWLGASVENQKYLERRMRRLLRIPAVIHFLSIEPLLAPVCIEPWCPRCQRNCVPRPGSKLSACCGAKCVPDWAIVGGESGQGARECQLESIRQIVQSCRAYGIALFIKQLGKVATMEEHGQRFALDLVHSKGGYIDEWPEEFQIREFPEVPLLKA